MAPSLGLLFPPPSGILIIFIASAASLPASTALARFRDKGGGGRGEEELRATRSFLYYHHPACRVTHIQTPPALPWVSKPEGLSHFRISRSAGLYPYDDIMMMIMMMMMMVNVIQMTGA